MPAPRVAGHLGRHLEDHELVRPGREPAVPSELIESAEDVHERVVRRLVGEIVELRPGDRLQPSAPARELVKRDSQHHLV